MDPFLQLTDITKVYPGVTALDHVSLEVRPGEVIGLVGENGAGKSTLMKILGGVVRPTAGALTIDGVARPDLNVPASIAAGIAFVHQELNLLENLDVAANVFMGREALRFGFLRLVDDKLARAKTRKLLDRLGADFKPETMVAELSIAQRQLVEIAKALSLDARLVIMDEPTSSLTLTETERLLRLIAELKASGVSVILVTHRLHEIEDSADRVVVLRDGRLAGALAGGEITAHEMIRLMIGRDLKSLYIPPARRDGAAVLDILGARTQAYPDKAVTLSLRAGEILGFAGLLGAGRTELARAIFGVDALAGGEVRVDGVRLIGGPRGAIANGVFLVPEDRKRSGVVLDMSIAENIALPKLPVAAAGLVSDRRVAAGTEAQKARLDIRAPDVAAQAGSLSGGNQQKVVLAKWLALNPRVLICDEPTRGVDVGAKREIYGILRGLADAGVAILMISSDMEEVIGVSDRIVVMHEGAISGMLERADFSEHNVLLHAVGAGHT